MSFNDYQVCFMLLRIPVNNNSSNCFCNALASVGVLLEKLWSGKICGIQLTENLKLVMMKAFLMFSTKPWGLPWSANNMKISAECQRYFWLSLMDWWSHFKHLGFYLNCAGGESSCWEHFCSFLFTSKSFLLDESPCLSQLDCRGINKSI